MYVSKNKFLRFIRRTKGMCLDINANKFVIQDIVIILKTSK